MTRALRLAAGGLLAIFGLASGLVAWAARSDFLYRDCQNIPRADWPASANCSDGWFGQTVFGAIAFALLAAALFLWRRRPAR